MPVCVSILLMLDGQPVRHAGWGQGGILVPQNLTSFFPASQKSVHDLIDHNLITFDT